MFNLARVSYGVFFIYTKSHEQLAEDGMTLECVIPQRDDRLEKTVDVVALKEAIGMMCPFWRKIVYLRYFKDLSQQKTADLLGVTQVRISREEKKIFKKMREELS